MIVILIYTGETEFQREKVTCPMSHSKWMAGTGLEPLLQRPYPGLSLLYHQAWAQAGDKSHTSSFLFPSLPFSFLPPPRLFFPPRSSDPRSTYSSQPPPQPLHSLMRTMMPMAHRIPAKMSPPTRRLYQSRRNPEGLHGHGMPAHALPIRAPS
mgnify:CR=1 FL=1